MYRAVLISYNYQNLHGELTPRPHPGPSFPRYGETICVGDSLDEVHELAERRVPKFTGYYIEEC